MQKTSKAIKNKFVSLVLIVFFVFGLFAFNTFEGGSCAGVTWSYNPSTNTATASGSGTTNFSELVQADIAGGWGGVYTSDTSGTQIKCNGKIIIGDGTNACAFSDVNKQILITYQRVTGGENYIEVKNNSTLTLGALDNEDDKATSQGCSLFATWGDYDTRLIYCSSGGIVYLYNSHFGCASASQQDLRIRELSAGSRVWNCILSYGAVLTLCNGTDVYNTLVSNGRQVANAGSQSAFDSCYGTFDSIRAYSMIAGIQAYGNLETIVTNAVFRNCTYVLLSTATRTINSYLINCDTDRWAFSFGASDSGKVFRQYTFNLNVLNGNITDFVKDATVQLWKDSVLVYEGTTNSSGMIPTQTLTYGFYQQSTGNAIQNASSPYYLVISHPDWQTYVSRFYITQPLRLTVSMQETTITGFSEVEKSDYTTIILFVISLILCIMGLALSVPLLPLISLTISVINIIFLSEPSIFNILLIILNVTFTLIALVRAKTKNN